MATEVLYPHDLLSQQRFRPHASDFFVTASPKRKPHHHRTANPAATTTTTNPSSSSNSSTSSRSSSRSPSNNNPRPSRKEVQKRRREGSGSPPPKPQAVTLLRRGESLDSAVASRSPSTSPSSVLRNNSKQGSTATGLLSTPSGGVLMTSARRSPPRYPVRSGDVYAGSAFSMSPAPSDLPLPSFFAAKKEASVVVSEESVDHSATKDLLRLLRLK